MIKYVELTAPEASAFRQAKILSIECNEGDRIKEGQTLFRVKSGSNEIDLPATREGRIVEIIATSQENITLSTPLLLLETEVPVSTASKPIIQDDATTPSEEKTPEKAMKSEAKPVKKKAPRKKKKKITKHRAAKKVALKKHQQQTLDLLGENSDAVHEVHTGEPVLDQTVKTESVNEEIADAPSSDSLSAVSPTMSSSTIQITVPDIGTDSAKVIEILVQPGDTVASEDPLITLESDKASMDVPSTHAGTVKTISVQLDQEVSEGTVILELDINSATTAAAPAAKPAPEKAQAAKAASSSTPVASAPSMVDVVIPDIGGDSAKVIEILVEVGQKVNVEDPLVTLESDKASMDVPSSAAGTIESIAVSIDQDVSEGSVVVKLKPDAAPAVQTATEPTPAPATTKTEPAKAESAPTSPTPLTQSPAPAGKSHASPSIRRFARELGVDLTKLNGSGRKNRITQEDVKAYVKGAMTGSHAPAATTGGSGIPPIPAQDFSKFGEIEVQPLHRIKRLTAANLHRSWVNVPHVTHNDESNINDLESFRKQLNDEYKKQGKDTKLSPLAFIVKAVVNALQTYPQFNSSLEPSGENLILKKYFHIGIAVDTPNGLVVPVVRNADKKSVAEIGREMNELAAKARDKKLKMSDMSGACLTISSLGGIGGTGFTPIVNAPEVAILGVSRSKMKPVWNGSEFIPGMMLPLSLSYDHRVIDGAEAARFTRHIAVVLEDVRRLTV